MGAAQIVSPACSVTRRKLNWLEYGSKFKFAVSSMANDFVYPPRTALGLLVTALDFIQSLRLC